MKILFQQQCTYFNISIVICFYLMIIIRCAELSENYVCDVSCCTSSTKESEVDKNKLLDENFASPADTSSPNPEQNDFVSYSCTFDEASNYAIEEIDNIKEKTIIDKLFEEQKKIINELKEHIKKTKYDIDWEILDKDIEFRCLYDDFLEYFDIVRENIIISNDTWLLNHDANLTSTFYNMEYVLCMINKLTKDLETKRLDLVQFVCLKQEKLKAIKNYNKMSTLYNCHVEKRDKLVDCFKDLIRFFNMIERIIRKNSKDLNTDLNGNEAELTMMEAFEMFDENNKSSLNALINTLKELQKTLTEDLTKTRDSIVVFLAYIDYDELNV